MSIEIIKFLGSNYNLYTGAKKITPKVERKSPIDGNNTKVNIPHEEVKDSEKKNINPYNVIYTKEQIKGKTR